MLSKEQIEVLFDEAVSNHKDYLLSKEGTFYPFNPDNIQEAISEMTDEQKVTMGAYAEADNYAVIGDYFKRVVVDYWTECADRKAMEDVQKNFDPSNCR